MPFLFSLVASCKLLCLANQAWQPFGCEVCVNNHPGIESSLLSPKHGTCKEYQTLDHRTFQDRHLEQIPRSQRSARR